MPSAAVETAFKARLDSLWSDSPVIDGIPQPDLDSISDEAFLVVQYPVQNSEKPVLGRTYFEEGAARLVLKVRTEVGLTEALPLADTLANIFRSRKFDGVETFEPSAPIINDQNDNGNWFELSVIVPYRYQFNSA